MRPNRLGSLTFVSDGMTPTAAKLALVVFGSDLVSAAIRAGSFFSREAAGSGFDSTSTAASPKSPSTSSSWLSPDSWFTWPADRLRWYLVWALSFAFLMLDDALMIHERVSERLSPLTGRRILPTGADPQAVGELGYFAVVGGIALVAIVGIVSSPGPFRRMSIDVIMLLALGAVVRRRGVDVFHGLLTLDYVGNSLFAVVEDGGEMAAVSLIVIYSAMVDGHAGRLTHWLANVRSLRS